MITPFTNIRVPLAIAGIAGMAGASASTALGIGALAGASGLGSKPASIKAPTKRDYLGEMKSALNAQSAVQQQQIDLEAQWTPQWQALQKNTLQGQMGMLNNLYSGALPQSAALQNAWANAQAPVYSNVANIATSAYNQTLDPATRGLFATLQSQARTGLDAGMGLTPEMERLAQQSARAAMTARGMAGGNQGIAAEVLNSYQLGNQRQMQAQNFATNVYNMGVQNAGNAMSQFGSPLLAQMSAVSPTGMIAQAQGMQQGLGAKLFQPESQYNAGIYGANQGNQVQTQLANAQISAGYNSGLMSMVGGLGSAYLSNQARVGGTTTSPQTNGIYNWIQG